MKAFRIWVMWRDVCEDSGVVILASDAEQALGYAASRGVAAGLGRSSKFVGLHAQPRSDAASERLKEMRR